MAKFSASLIAAAKKAMFNANKWSPVGEPVSLKDLWAVTAPGLYKKIDGTTAEVTEVIFSDGSTGTRIAIPIKGGKPVEIPVSTESELAEGDIVKISTIMGQELEKAGQENIIRFDAELAEEDEE